MIFHVCCTWFACVYLLCWLLSGFFNNNFTMQIIICIAQRTLPSWCNNCSGVTVPAEGGEGGGRYHDSQTPLMQNPVYAYAAIAYSMLP